MSAELLARRLAALGLQGRVEAHGRMAVLTVRDPAAALDAAVRHAAVAAARDAGFAALALELDQDRAALPGA